MRSTGEVMGLDTSFEKAFAKSQLAAGINLPVEGTVFVSVKETDRTSIIDAVRLLLDLGFTILGTRGTAKYLAEHGLQIDEVNKVREGRPHIVDAMKNNMVDLVINTTEGAQAIVDSFSIRETALLEKIPYYTTVAGALAAAQAIATLRAGSLEVASLQSYSK